MLKKSLLGTLKKKKMAEFFQRQLARRFFIDPEEPPQERTQR